MTKPVLDHVAIGTLALSDGWDLFGGLLGGSWLYGGNAPGFWWGQLRFRTGPKIELITPTGGPDAGFLERFLAARGAGPHHFNFIVPDISATLSRVRAVGVEPVSVSLSNPTWKEAFLHPKDAFGIVVQVAEQAGRPPELPAPAGLPAVGPPSAFTVVEHQVADLDSAVRLFADALEGAVVSRSQDSAAPSVAELTWENGARLRLVSTTPAGRGAAAVASRGGELRHLQFRRDGAAFSPADLEQAAGLAGRLGVALQLGD